jgi:hypothetical protein
VNEPTNERLASQPASQVDRLNSIVQVIITVLLNTSIAECVCLALLSGSVPFELFIHLGHFLFLYHMYALRIHTNYICFLLFFFFFESVVLYVHTGIITITVSQRRRYFSLEFTLLQLLVVMMLVVYVTYMHIYGAVIVVAR